MVVAEDTGQGKYQAGHHAEEVQLVEDTQPALFRFLHAAVDPNRLDEVPVRPRDLAQELQGGRFRRIEFNKPYQGWWF